MNVLIAPLEFKGTLTAREAAEAIAEGLRAARPEWRLDVLPLSDGGPGMVDAMLTANGGWAQVATVHDPLGRPVEARWGELGDGTAVIEMAAASGLSLLTAEEHAPLRTSSFGTGELIRAALEAGHRRVIIGAGGSATNDGGAGALEALGCVLRDSEGAEIDRGGGALGRAFTLDLSRLLPAARESELIVATDVTAPLLGRQGASHVFGPQKGASALDVARLDEALGRFADLVAATVGRDLRDVPGAGAAGGLAFGLAAVLGARIAPGFELLAHQCSLSARIAAAELVITGEGRLDAQTAMGKGPTRLAQRAGRERTVALVGRVDGDAAGAFREVVVVTPADLPPDRLVREAAALLREGARRWASAFRP